MTQSLSNWYGPANTDLSPYEIVLKNGSTGADYNTIDLAGQTIPADGFFVISWNTATVPNTDLALTGTGQLQNGDPDSIVLQQKSDDTAIDALAYFVSYSGNPAGNMASLPVGSWEGQGAGAGGDSSFPVQTGTLAPTNRLNATIGRFPDGEDTNDNESDFISFYVGAGHPNTAGTPGESNATGLKSIPYTDDFGSAGVLDDWIVTYTDMKAETAATAVPTAIPDSPDTVSPSNWISVKDNTGGGDEALFGEFLGQDYLLEAYCYGGPISSSTDGTEIGGLGGRVAFTQNNDNSGTFALDPSLYATVSPYGPASYKWLIDYVTGDLLAVKFENTVYTVVETVPNPFGTTGKWLKLGINFNGTYVQYFVDGEKKAELAAEVPRAGYALLGYREASTATTGLVRANFDALSIKPALPPIASVNDWSVY